MAIKPELKAWLDTLPLSAEAKNALTPELEKDEVGGKVLETVLLRSDYSRALNNKDAEIAAEREKAENARLSYVQFQQTEQEKVNNFYKEQNAKLAAAQTQLKAYEGRLGQLVADGLITQEEAGIARQDFIASQAQAPQGQPQARYVSEEKLQQTIGSISGQNVYAIAKINDIADAHFDLFGQRLSREELVAKTLEVNEKRRLLKQPEMKVEEVWRTLYDVDKKRTELQQAADAARIKSAVDEALVRDRSERAIAGDAAPYSGLDDGGNKHILSIFSAKDGGARAQGVSPSVARAAEAFRQGTLGRGEPKQA